MTDKTQGAPARSALKLALEALECDPLDMALNPDGHMGFRKDQAITAIREALAEQPAQQEPHGYLKLSTAKFFHEVEGTNPMTDKNYLPLYTTPPIEATPLASQRNVKPWVGLTDEEAIFLIENEILGRGDLIETIEAKLKEKNSD